MARPSFRVSTVLLAGWFAAWSAAGPADAFTLFGKRFFESGDPETAVVPDAQPYTLDFTVASDSKELKQTVQGASSLYGDTKRPPPGTAGLIARARGDYARIEAALYARGYYAGVIHILIGGREPEAIRADETLPDPVAVTVSVDPGPLFRFGTFDIRGNPPPVDTGEDAANVNWRKLDIKPGDPARSGQVVATERAVVDAWRQRSYAKAKAADRKVVADHRTDTVDVTLNIDPGRAALFGPVTVTGTERMNPRFTAYMTGLKVGQEYDPDTLKRATERLRRLEVFSSVSVQEADLIDQAGLLPIIYNLAERKLHVIGGGGSFSTTDGAALEAYWQHRNLFGQAESLRLEASVSHLASTDPKEFSYLIGTTFKKPGVFTPDTDLTLKLYGKRQFVDNAYTQTGVSASVGLDHQFSERLKGSSAVQVERSHVNDAFGSHNYLLASLPSTLEYDSRDNKLDPTKGIDALFAAEPYAEIKSGTFGVVTKGSVASYLALDQDGRMVLAGRLALGSIPNTGSLEDIPADRRFFLGGGGSIRGYEYRTVGPRRDGEVIGGRSFWEASGEFRFRLSKSFGVVPFVDLGAAYRDAIPDFSEDVRVGIGLGLRYYTGLGPIRFDLALPMVRKSGDPHFAFYVGLGQAF